MLEVCHRKGCLWYSWKLSLWEYNIEKVYSEFETENYGQQLTTSFITKRLQDLPSAARAILAWASLLGNTFSFALVQKLLSAEFDYVDHHLSSSKSGCSEKIEVFKPQPAKNVVQGLQATLQSYILMPGSSDDQFWYALRVEIRVLHLLYAWLTPTAFHMIDIYKHRHSLENVLTRRRCILSSYRR